MSYRRILEHADEFFRSVMQSQPQNLQCGRGCSLCCYGLFEFGRAVEISAESRHPNVRESTPVEKDAFFSRTASTACPNLNESGECMIYEHRPRVCRTFGVPIRDGDSYIGDVCDLNFNDASDEQRTAASWV